MPNELDPLLIALQAQTEAIHAQTLAIDRLAESNMQIVDLLASQVQNEPDDEPKSSTYLDGSPK